MNKKNLISYLAAILYSLAVPSFAQEADVRVCIDARILYAANGFEGSTYEYSLDEGAGAFIQTHNDSIIVQWSNAPGFYRLGVRETSLYGCEGDWAFLNVELVGERAQFTQSTYNICGDSCVYVDFDKSNFLAWEWVNKTIPEDGRITVPGRYELRTIDQNHCVLSSFVDVVQTPMPKVTLPPDTMICNTNFTLYALDTQDNPFETVYTWSTGETGLFANIISSGSNVKSVMIGDRNMDVDTRYWVTAELNGCVASDTMTIRACVIPDRMNIPNTFTPNDDGDNDTWIIRVLQDYPHASVEVFDRWNRRVFIAPNGYTTPWNGRDTNGRELPMETYYYIIHLNDGMSQIPVTGTITIIR